MSDWMESDGVLSSFHFNVFSDSLQIRSPLRSTIKTAVSIMDAVVFNYAGVGG